MLINKLKWTVVTLTASSLVLVAVGTGMRAIASQVEKKAGVENVKQESEFPKHVDYFKKILPPASLVAGKLEFEANESLADRLEEEMVEAELLETKTEALRSVILNNLQTIRQYESTPTSQRASFGGLGGVVQAEIPDRIRELKDQTEITTHRYKEDRLQLARLKRRIARETKALDQPTTVTDPASINRRLESLESKVDQILKLLDRPALNALP
jgi:hypothetical protein